MEGIGGEHSLIWVQMGVDLCKSFLLLRSVSIILDGGKRFFCHGLTYPRAPTECTRQRFSFVG